MENTSASQEITGFRPDMAALRAVIEPLVAAHGLALVDVEWVAGPIGKILRVTIERPEAPTEVSRMADGAIAGVALADCVSVSRDLSTALDAGDLIAQAYNLEVSSPGLDRPLRNERDFSRQIGRLAKVKLTRPAVDGQLALRGTILAASDQGIRMEVDGKEHDVSFDQIREAKLVFELGAQPKKGSRAPRSAYRPGAPRTPGNGARPKKGHR